MTRYSYKTNGTCSSQINFDLDAQKKIHNVEFIGGCHGNLQGISKLIEGMNAKDISVKLSGIRCGNKQTSCPDQLSRAIKEALNS